MTAPALVAVRSVIEDSIANQPRSQQKAIGPSEIGTPCLHCLAAKLAGWEENRDTAWLPFIGTCVHAEMDVIFTMANDPVFRWTTEKRVMVGHLGGREVWGSCDLFDHDTGTVIDFKVTGKSTLDKAKRGGPTDVYRTQAHLYGQGWVNAGQQVSTVAIAYLPRNAVSLDHAVWWSEPYDPVVAHAALERADRLATTLGQLEAASIEARDVYITSLPRDADCFSCQRYPDRPITETTGLLDLIA